MKKAQATTIIVIILLVIIAIGIFYVGYNFSNKPTTIGNVVKDNQEVHTAIITPPFYINAWKVTNEGIQAEIRNIGVKDYIIQSIEVNGCAKVIHNDIVNTGNVVVLTIPCHLTSGTQFKGDIIIEYNKLGESTSLISTGTISEIVG